MKTFSLSHLKQTSYPSMHKWRSFRTSNLTPKVSGLNFFQVHKRTKIQFLKKIKWYSKIYLLRIIKTLLLYHLKQTSWQSMHKWSFRTSKFTPKVSGLKFFWVHKHTKIRFKKIIIQKLEKYFLWKKGNGLFFNLKQVS